jgi:hypothetical protein
LPPPPEVDEELELDEELLLELEDELELLDELDELELLLELDEELEDELELVPSPFTVTSGALTLPGLALKPKLTELPGWISAL